MDELLTMSNTEINRIEVMQRLKDIRLLQKEAARIIRISIRQVKRLYRACQAESRPHLLWSKLKNLKESPLSKI